MMRIFYIYFIYYTTVAQKLQVLRGNFANFREAVKPPSPREVASDDAKRLPMTEGVILSRMQENPYYNINIETLSP